MTSPRYSGIGGIRDYLILSEQAAFTVGEVPGVLPHVDIDEKPIGFECVPIVLPCSLQPHSRDPNWTGIVAVPGMRPFMASTDPSKGTLIQDVANRFGLIALIHTLCAIIGLPPGVVAAAILDHANRSTGGPLHPLIVHGDKPSLAAAVRKHNIDAGTAQYNSGQQLRALVGTSGAKLLGLLDPAVPLPAGADGPVGAAEPAGRGLPDIWMPRRYVPGWLQHLLWALPRWPLPSARDLANPLVLLLASMLCNDVDYENRRRVVELETRIHHLQRWAPDTLRVCLNIHRDARQQLAALQLPEGAFKVSWCPNPAQCLYDLLHLRVPVSYTCIVLDPLAVNELAYVQGADPCKRLKGLAVVPVHGGPCMSMALNCLQLIRLFNDILTFCGHSNLCLKRPAHPGIVFSYLTAIVNDPPTAVVYEHTERTAWPLSELVPIVNFLTPAELWIVFTTRPWGELLDAFSVHMLELELRD